MKDDYSVGAYSVEGEVDYQDLITKFGIRPIDEELKARIKKDANDIHFMIRRGIYFAHRDMPWLLDQYEKGNKFYVYTGIAPSGGMTIAHLIPFVMSQWLQEKFDAEVYIQIPDEEKYLAKRDTNLTLEKAHELAYADALNIVALGFKPGKTKIFTNTEYAGVLYKQAVRVSKYITFSIIKDAFGFGNDSNIGTIFYTSMQAVPAFLKSVEQGKNVPCLIPLGVDQDVHFRVARNAIDKLGYYKPAIMHSKFMPSLKGGPKMSSSDPDNTIYLDDAPDVVEKKVNKAITGQQSTAELQKKLGGNPDKCAVCQYNRYLFEPDDKKLAEIFEGERKGTLLAGEHKKDLAQKINHFLQEHRKKKEKLETKLKDFMITG
ncbi:MAG: tryptophan--tRNA ligase [Candidatus Micrarchaeota archaeon]|nr:tryptophan--tRNA ligase [Candidatus Micrarchaeota archaeon]MDE1833708.1 tryptophan--tRNA ligase [Candidatus Micrarchaeota archaeon]MDE1859762.1 tryptophan--tRNA ligase [Candidatus Micrarchaeota archaeon]